MLEKCSEQNIKIQKAITAIISFFCMNLSKQNILCWVPQEVGFWFCFGGWFFLFCFVLFLNTLLISLMDFGNWKLENNNKILLKPGTESTNLLLLFMQTIFRPMISLKNISHIGAVVLYLSWIPTAMLMPGKTSSNGINISSSPQKQAPAFSNIWYS